MLLIKFAPETVKFLAPGKKVMIKILRRNEGIRYQVDCGLKTRRICRALDNGATTAGEQPGF